MTNRQDPQRNAFMLKGAFAHRGYDWWWHSFTAIHEQTGEEKAFFIEFFTVNPALGGEAPILGQLPERPIPSYLMVKAGCWGEDARQLHRFFGWSSVTIAEGAPYSVRAEDCYASDTRLSGSVCVTDAEAHPEYMCDNGSMRWELTLSKQIAFNVGYGAGRALRDAEAFEMYWHAEGMKTLYAGTVELDGERYIVTPERSYGYADKNWGCDFTTPWVWLSSCRLRSRLTGHELRGSAFDIGGGRPKAFGIALERKLLGAFTYEGRDYEFNFSKPWTGSRTEFDCRETDTEIVWHVVQETLTARMETDITCPKREMLLVNYEAPDGSRRHTRLWNGGTGTGAVRLYERHLGRLRLIDDIECLSVGCEYGEYEQESGRS